MRGWSRGGLAGLDRSSSRGLLNDHGALNGGGDWVVVVVSMREMSLGSRRGLGGVNPHGGGDGNGDNDLVGLGDPLNVALGHGDRSDDGEKCARGGEEVHGVHLGTWKARVKLLEEAVFRPVRERLKVIDLRFEREKECGGSVKDQRATV